MQVSLEVTQSVNRGFWIYIQVFGFPGKQIITRNVSFLICLFQPFLDKLLGRVKPMVRFFKRKVIGRHHPREETVFLLP